MFLRGRQLAGAQRGMSDPYKPFLVVSFEGTGFIPFPLPCLSQQEKS